jgi:hypothetical protein
MVGACVVIDGSCCAVAGTAARKASVITVAMTLSITFLPDVDLFDT